MERDEDEFKFVDLDSDGIKEILLKHSIWKGEDVDSKRPGEIRYRVFKYNKVNSDKFLEVKDRDILEKTISHFIHK